MSLKILKIDGTGGVKAAGADGVKLAGTNVEVDAAGRKLTHPAGADDVEVNGVDGVNV